MAGGFATYAVVDDNIEVTVAELQAAGSSIGPVTHGTRVRADGELVEYWVAMPERLGPDAPPFLIKHAYVGPEWGAGALAARRAATHPIGSPAILARLDWPPRTQPGWRPSTPLSGWSSGPLPTWRSVLLGPHTIRLVPSREMEVPAAVVIGAAVENPHTVEAWACASTSSRWCSRSWWG